MSDLGAPNDPNRATIHDQDGGFPDHARTARSHAGEGIEDGYNIPGIVMFALGIVALGLTLTAAAYGFAGWVIIGAVVCAVGLLGGSAWILLEHRRVKAREGLSLSDQAGH
ncbi:MAG TPA: hypothetical protein VK083_09785 [Nocardia sp.]|uniref:hypothetical protein n=1 Tax=Nocardia sp. TaxID=1821 RepID=UPI002B4AEC6F|nr:hypothetical protein [Nocardia sp.]HLS77067.1 hypothetical protein [Nocardia sp.]